MEIIIYVRILSLVLQTRVLYGIYTLSQYDNFDLHIHVLTHPPKFLVSKERC